MAAVKVLERRRVSPPPGSVPPVEIDLTFFDAFWLLPFPPVQRVFFYYFPGTTTTTEDFRRRDELFPLLERSLSHALALFYPLAGRLVPLPDSDVGDHVIRFGNGDSVPLVLAESSADFGGLVRNDAKEDGVFHGLVPPLDSSDGGDGTIEETPLAAFQVTVFPGSGVAIGVAVNHVAADGTSSVHFVKSWASIFRAGGDVSAVKTVPVLDRNLVGDLRRLKLDYLEGLQKSLLPQLLSELATQKKPPPDRVVRSTFVLTRAHIQKLRDKISSYVGPAHEFSSFTLTCAYVWHCMEKSRDETSEGKTVYFGFMADCRSRLHPPVPPAYFGNCIVPTGTRASCAELARENGLVTAAETIRRVIRGLSEGVLKHAESLVSMLVGVIKERIISLAGSPRFHVYDIDFGWGRPRKVEVVSINHNGAISLAESADQEGGVEIGLVGPEVEISRFTACFEEGLREL